MIGCHTYYQTKDDKEFSEINYLIQLSSILYWKKNYGEIKLYCNNKFLQSIKKYGLDKEYSEINTDLLENSPYGKYSQRFWSFNKIYVVSDIAKKEEAFCMIDTDLWIAKPNMLRNDVDILFYHKEHVDSARYHTAYPDADNWLGQDVACEFDWKIAPRNCAIMCFNSNFKEIVQAWKSLSIQIMEDIVGKDLQHLNKDSHTIFIEQRLFPTLACKLGATIAEILPNTFVPYPHEWEPALGHTAESDYVANNIRHIWGFKQFYAEAKVRKLVLEATIPATIGIVENKSEYFPLLETCKKYLQEII